MLSDNFTLRSQDQSIYIAYDDPEQDAYLRIDWAFQPQWNWNLQMNWIGERKCSSTDTRAPVDDYLLTDTTIRYAGSKKWEYAISIRNLFDTDAREYTGKAIPNDLPLPRRNFYAEMRYKF